MKKQIELRIEVLTDLINELENNKKFNGYATEYKQGYNQALIDAHKRELTHLQGLLKLTDK